MEKEELLKLIKEEYYRIKPKSSNEFFKECDTRIPSVLRLKKMFNNASYNQILIMADVDKKYLNGIKIDKQEYLNRIRKIVERLGYIPTVQELDNEGIVHKNILKYFGSYKTIVRELEKENFIRKLERAEVKESNNQLLQMYIDFCNKIQKVASPNDLNNSDEIYNVGVFINRFGGMKELKRLAGFKINDETKNKKYTKEAINDKLSKKIIERNKMLTTKEIDSDPELPASSTILRCYRTSKITNVYKEILSVIKQRDINIYNNLVKR